MNQIEPKGTALVTQPAEHRPEVELAPPVLRSWDDMVAQGFNPVPPNPARDALRSVLQAEADAQDARRAAFDPSAKD